MHNKLVLVVEDDDPIRKLLGELLQAAGLRVRTLPDGDRVVDVARESPPGLILLDIGLPGTHGLAVLDELKAQPDLAALPVVVISAWCDSGLVERALAAGAVDYVRKPFATDELVRRVKAAMSSAPATEPKELPEDVLRAMREDRLTGLPNRIGLEERCAEAVAMAREHGVPLSLVLVRIDRYEEIGQTGDRRAGDLLVRMLASDLGRRLRPGDALGRLAEDTFLVVAPRCDLTAAGEYADTLRAAAAGVRARAGWTVSAGYAATDACDSDELLGCCDIALSVATAAGGDATRAGVPVGRLKVA